MLLAYVQKSMHILQEIKKKLTQGYMICGWVLGELHLENALPSQLCGKSFLVAYLQAWT